MSQSKFLVAKISLSIAIFMSPAQLRAGICYATNRSVDELINNLVYCEEMTGEYTYKSKCNVEFDCSFATTSGCQICLTPILYKFNNTTLEWDIEDIGDTWITPLRSCGSSGNKAVLTVNSHCIFGPIYKLVVKISGDPEDCNDVVLTAQTIWDYSTCPQD